MTAAAHPLPAQRSARRAAIARALNAADGGWLLGGLALLAFVATVILFYPGFMSADSGDQLGQARSGVLVDHHPILMALVWRLTDRILPGPAGMLILTSALYWGGLAGICWGLARPLWLRAAGLLAVGFFIPSACCVAGVWKDTFMHAAMLAAVACLVIPPRGARWLRYALALVLFLLALGLRHNAAAAVWPLLLLLLLELPVLADRARWLRLLLACGAALLMTLLLTIGLRRALAPLAKAENFWQESAVFDLAGISLKLGRIVVDPEVGLVPPGVGLAEIRLQFRPDYQNTLHHCAVFSPHRCVLVFNILHDPQQLSRLARNWVKAIVQHPIAYLAHRSNMAARLLRLGNLEPPRKYYFLEEIPDLHHPLARQYGPSPSTRRTLSWLDRQQTAPVFAPWIYALASCLLLPLTLVWYLRGGPLLPLAFTLSGLSYLLSVLLMAGGPDPRYTAWTILCTLLAALGCRRPDPATPTAPAGIVVRGSA